MLLHREKIPTTKTAKPIKSEKAETRPKCLLNIVAVSVIVKIVRIAPSSVAGLHIHLELTGV